MNKGKFNNFTFFCRTEHQASNVSRGINEPFKGDDAIIMELFHKYPEKHNQCIDIGANIGTFSIFLSTLFDNVIAYEPQIDNFELLTNNITENNRSNIMAYNYGIMNIEDSFEIENHDKSEGIHPGTYFINIEKKGSIETKNLVSELEKNHINKVDFIKIDTEGSEFIILQSIETILVTHKPILCVEINECSLKNYGINSNQITKYLINLGYKIYKINGCNYYFI